MSDEKDRRLRSIAQSALQLDPADRKAFLDQVCASQPSLRQEIEALISEQPPAAAAVHEVNTIAGGSKTPVLPAETTAVHKVGERIGPYEITGQLGQGGMGVVYRARDVRLERDVALKVLPAGLNNDPQTRRRLLREARAASQINHPNVVTIYEVAEYGGTQFIAMEYVDGKTLARAIPMLPEEAIACAIQIAQALVKAHAHGVIHRDLKPGNIVLTRDGLAKVLDFGLAVQTASRPETDQTVTVASTVGSIVGTPAYMSPEQAEGQTTDAQSDIFSFGAVLYEMLSGQRAFRGSTAVAALASVLRDEPVPVSQIVPGIWPELDDVVTRCLRKDKSTRYASMTEVLLDLETASQRRSPTGGKGKVPSVAVLAFADLSPGQENEYFGDGLAEEIIIALSRLPGLKVTARTSAFSFKGKSQDVRAVAATLNVGHVLEGSVRKIGNRIRVTVQLLAASSGDLIWAERFDRQLEDVFAIQDEISQAVVSALEIKLARPASAGHGRTTNMEAYQAYLEGRFHLYQFTPDSMERCRQLLEKAITLAPDFALPHAALAEYYYYLVGLHGRRPRDFMPQLLASAERALALDPELSEAYVARAMYRTMYEYDWAGAARDFTRAIDINPSSAIAHYRYAYFFLRTLGRFEEAMAENDRAFELDPLSVQIRFGTPTLSLLLADYEKALKQVQAALALYPSAWLGCWLSGQIFAYVRRHREAEEVLQRGLSLLPDNPLLLGTLAMSRNLEGRLEDAAPIKRRLEELASERYISPAAIYVAHIGAQTPEQAYERLTYAIEERDPFAASTLNNFAREFTDHPLFLALRDQLRLPKLQDSERNALKSASSLSLSKRLPLGNP